MLEKIWKVVGIVFLASLFPGLYFQTVSSGSKAFTELAIEYQYCEDAESCSQRAKDDLAESIVLGTNYTSIRQIQWCLGVDAWADTRVRKGGWIIGFMMEGGYFFCPSVK